MKKFIIQLLFIFLMASSAFAQPKIWETENEVIDNIGSVQIRMSKMYNRDAEPGSFQADAFHRENSVMSVFRGVCAELVTMEVIAKDARKLDLNRFLKTRSGNDLPIREVLDVMQNTLSGQCDNLKVIRFTFRPAHQTKEDYSYEGTLLKSNGWRIQDGKVETAFDSALVFEIAYRDFFSVGGIHYKGSCEENPVLMLEPQFANNQERALAKPVEFYTWAGIAKEVSKLYEEKCSKVQEIQFIVNPLAQNYKCKIKGEDCFLISRKTEEWEVDMSQMVEKDYVPPIRNFKDITEVLAAGKHEILDDYSSFFAFYFESFIGIYSDHCGSYIKDPVAKDIFTIEREFDDSGFLINEKIDGPPRRINIERSYVDSFDRIFNSWKMWGVGQMMSRMLKSHHRETNPMLAVQLSMGFFTGNYNALEHIVQGDCSDARIQTAYANMYNYANHKQPIVGKFKTNKKKLVRDKPNGPSAPQAAQIIFDKRKKKVDEQNQRAQTRAQKRMEDFKKRKAEGIAVHGGSKARQSQADPTIYQNKQDPYGQGKTSNVSGNSNDTELLKKYQENQKKMQELGQQYQKEVAAALEKFSQDMQNAKTHEERLSIQKEYRDFQQKRTFEMQQTIMTLKGR